jgi:hypothetical protein
MCGAAANIAGGMAKVAAPLAAMYYYPGYTILAGVAYFFVADPLGPRRNPDEPFFQQGGETRARMGSQTQTVDPDASDSIENIKAKIQQKETLPPGQQRMVFMGNETSSMDEIDLATAPMNVLIDFFAESSVEELFHYIRFSAFISSTPEQKKELIKSLSQVSCRAYDTITPILTFMKSDDIVGLLAFAKTREVPVDIFIDELEATGVKAMAVKDINEIIDVYFEETDPALSLRVLQTLLFFDVVDGGIIYKNYVSNLRSMESKDKEFATCTHFEHSFII